MNQTIVVVDSVAVQCGINEYKVILIVGIYVYIMSVLKQPINYMGLEYELEESLKADTKYQLENDAKLRAIEQNVPSYEHFRQMVNGAHLKPLERKDTDEMTKVSWNLLKCEKGIESNQTSLIKNSAFPKNNREQNSYVLFKSVQEFYEKWKVIDGVEDKIKFLLDARDLLPDIFQIEIPTNILGEFLNVCLHALTIMEDQCSSLMYVIDILTSLTTCNRFQLAITFMTIQDKSVCRQLFDKILFLAQNNSIGTSAIIQLGKKFQVTL